MKPLPSPDFAFLTPYSARVVLLATQAEVYFHDDPNTALLKLRQFGEEMLRLVVAHAGLRVPPKEDQIDRSKEPQACGVLPLEVGVLFHAVRARGNAANYEVSGSYREAI